MERLKRTLDVCAMVPIFLKDDIIMTLMFRGAVLCSLGAHIKEVLSILEARRKYMQQ